MRAKAPGKLVLSGAYSVLEGAPALIAAVDRYAVADGGREALRVTPEVAEAVRRGALTRPVWFDADSLRENVGNGESRKLGLGSSAAILVASLAATYAGNPTGPGLAATLFPDALAIHRSAQGGGSGVDVAASCFGGVSVCRLEGDALVVARAVLPPVTFEAWICPQSASTPEMLARVRALAAGEPSRYRRILGAAREGAIAATAASSPPEFVDALLAQRGSLAELGRASGACIMTPEVDALHELAVLDGGIFYPSGAGGGDIALHVGTSASSSDFRARAALLGLSRVALVIGASGVERF